MRYQLFVDDDEIQFVKVYCRKSQETINTKGRHLTRCNLKCKYWYFRNNIFFNIHIILILSKGFKNKILILE